MAPEQLSQLDARTNKGLLKKFAVGFCHAGEFLRAGHPNGHSAHSNCFLSRDPLTAEILTLKITKSIAHYLVTFSSQASLNRFILTPLKPHSPPKMSVSTAWRR